MVPDSMTASKAVLLLFACAINSVRRNPSCGGPCPGTKTELLSIVTERTCSETTLLQSGVGGMVVPSKVVYWCLYTKC